MNKKYFLFTLIILVIAGLITYFYLSPKPVHNVSTRTLTLIDRQYLSKDTTRGTLNIDINVEIPVKYRDKDILDSIRTIITGNLFGNLVSEASSPDSILKNFAIELKKEYIRNNSGFAGKLSRESKLELNNTFVMEGFSLLNDENIYSYGISKDIDLGGTYPSKTRFFYNFNLKTGKMISEEDIFKEGFADELSDIIKAQILANSKINDEIPEIDTFDDTEYIAEAIRPNGNFYINDEAICYVFNPYEIAPVYYVGETEVVLTYDKIRHLMKDKSPVSYLLKTTN